MQDFANTTRTRLITNDTAEEMLISFPADDVTVINNLQVNNISGDVQYKGTGKLLGEPSDYIPIPEGGSMNFMNMLNHSPNGAKTIKLAVGAVISLIAYD